jgi:hypothetical protein
VATPVNLVIVAHYKPVFEEKSGIIDHDYAFTQAYEPSFCHKITRNINKC